MEGLTRGQLAKRARINLETVRFYEQEGLLAAPSRTASGYRKFAEAEVGRLAFVRRAKSLGFSLKEIRELLIFQDEPADACAEVRELLKKKLAVVREKQSELEKLEAHLRSALRKCNRALARQSQQQEACPVLDQMTDPDPHRNHGGSHA
ncbi:MAG: heavy metal-responsive transcriptional regulator [Acidobacteriaceae bacterium]